MDIFRLLYIERLKSSAIAVGLNRRPSGITRELEKGMDNGMYNPIVTGNRCKDTSQLWFPPFFTDANWEVK
jgi:IS30 family transposase